MNTCYCGARVNETVIRTKEGNQFLPRTHLPSSFPLFSFFDALAKTIVPSGLSLRAAPCLLDNYRLARRRHYRYKGELFPNYVRRDMNMAPHLLGTEIFSVW